MTEPEGPAAGATSIRPRAHGASAEPTDPAADPAVADATATATGIGLALRRCFVAALVAGAALVAWGEHAGLGATPLAAGGPLAVMAIYLGVGLRCQRAEAARTRLAESTFHLGVLLAGVSLLGSLLVLGEAGARAPGAEASAALVTPDGTGLAVGLARRLAGALPMLLFGHAARVCLTRFRPSCEETTADVQVMLAASARTLRARLDQLSTDLQAQAGAMNVVLRSTLQGVQGELARILTTGGAAFDHALRDMRASVTGSLDRVRRRLDTVSEETADSASRASSQVTDAATSALRSLDAAAEALRRRIEASELPADVFTRQLHEPLEELARVIAVQAKRMDEASASLAAAQAILDEQLRLAERMRER